MKNLFHSFLIIFSLFAIVSCGGEDTSEQEEQDIAVSLRVAKGVANCNSLTIFDTCLLDQIAAINFIIQDKDGNRIKQQSIEKKNLGNQVAIKGIKAVKNATLIVEVLESSNNRTPILTGMATDLEFEKGKETTVKIQLYPANQTGSEAAMPNQFSIPRFGHTATVLTDGRILVAGGFTSCGSSHKCTATNTVEIIDLESGEIEKLADMLEPRALHKAVLMDDGSVVFIGGVKALNASAQTEDEAFENYPPLPYSFLASAAVTKLEQYMPSYPKYNKKQNNPELSRSNETKPINAEIPFKAFQSILIDQTADNKANVFLVGGLDVEESENSENSKGTPSKKSYTFSITNSGGTASTSTVTPLAESSEPMLYPALAHSNGSILAVGGRPGNSEYAASLISESSSEDKGQNIGLNLFFTNNFAVGSNLYTCAGFNAEKGEEDETASIDFSHKILKWGVFEDSPVSGQDENEKEYFIYPGKEEVAFAETVYDEANERFILIGGTGEKVRNVYQVINAATLERYQNAPSHLMPASLIMSKAVIIPAEKSPTGKTFIVITGGINSIDGTGSPSGIIRVNNI